MNKCMILNVSFTKYKYSQYSWHGLSFFITYFRHIHLYKIIRPSNQIRLSAHIRQSSATTTAALNSQSLALVTTLQPFLQIWLLHIIKLFPIRTMIQCPLILFEPSTATDTHIPNLHTTASTILERLGYILQIAH